MAKIKATGIILAGGQSRRMQKNKAFLPVGAFSLIEIILQKMHAVCQELLIITNNPEEYAHLGVPVTSDLIPHQGPLSGIHAGLTASIHDHNLVVACDMPFIHAELAAYFLEKLPGFEAVIPRFQDQPQPLFAAYTKDCIAPIERCLQTERKRATKLHRELNVLWIKEEEIRRFVDPAIVFCNLNTPEDWACTRLQLIKESLALSRPNL